MNLDKNQSLSEQIADHLDNRAMAQALKKEHDWCDGQIARLKRDRDALLESLKVILYGFEKGIFVRDVTRDHESSWVVRLVPFMVALGKAQAAVVQAEEQL